MNDAIGYEQTANELVRRIKALPGVLDIHDPFDLLAIDGFKCDDLRPSLFQVSWALRRAQHELRESETSTRGGAK